MLGGTLVQTHGVFFRNVNADVSCSFDGISTRGVIVDATKAVCVSPRFHQAGSKTFHLYIDDEVVVSNNITFYASQYICFKMIQNCDVKCMFLH